MLKLTATILAILSLANSPMLFASSQGGYAGIGVSTMDDFNDAVSMNRGGFAGRLYGGINSIII